MLKIPTHKSNSGFTLIEIIVSLGIFAIVAVVAIGALMTASNLNRKAQAIKLVMDNLNFALDSMLIKVRQGGNYCIISGSASCQSYSPGTLCNGSGDAFYFEIPDQAQPEAFRRFVYRFTEDAAQKGSLEFCEVEVTGDFLKMTLPAIDLDDLMFGVVGVGELGSPRVSLNLFGTADIQRVGVVNFALQTTATAR